MQDIFNTSQWFSEPIAYWTIQYEYKRSGADMQYRFYWKVWLKSSSSWYNNGLQLQLFLNGVQHNITVKGYASGNNGWSYDGTTEWYTVPNKTSGTTPFYAKLYDTSLGYARVTSSQYNLAISGAMSSLAVINAFDVDRGFEFSITKYDASFDDTLIIGCGNTIVAKRENISARLEANETWKSRVVFDGDELENIYSKMSTKVSEEFTFMLTTESDGKLIGMDTKTSIGSVSNANPTFTKEQISYTDADKVLWNITKNEADNQRFVQNLSPLSVTFGEAEGNKGANIAEYILEVNGVKKTVTESGTVNFGTINSSKDVTLKVTAKDSRGNTTTVEKPITVLEWSLPKFTVELQRLNNYEDETHLTVNASISSVGGINYIKFMAYKCIEVGDVYANASWIPIENKTMHTTSVDKNKEYYFLVDVTDLFDYDSKEYYLPKGKFPLFIDTQKSAVGINEFPADNEALRVAGGVARFDEGIVLLSSSKKFLLSVDNSGTLNIKEIN